MSNSTSSSNIIVEDEYITGPNGQAVNVGDIFEQLAAKTGQDSHSSQEPILCVDNEYIITAPNGEAVNIGDIYVHFAAKTGKPEDFDNASISAENGSVVGENERGDNDEYDGPSAPHNQVCPIEESEEEPEEEPEAEEEDEEESESDEDIDEEGTKQSIEEEANRVNRLKTYIEKTWLLANYAPSTTFIEQVNGDIISPLTWNEYGQFCETFFEKEDGTSANIKTALPKTWVDAKCSPPTIIIQQVDGTFVPRALHIDNSCIPAQLFVEQTNGIMVCFTNSKEVVAQENAAFWKTYDNNVDNVNVYDVDEFFSPNKGVTGEKIFRPLRTKVVGAQKRKMDDPQETSSPKSPKFNLHVVV